MLYTFLKLVRDDASFPSAERPFQALAPLKEKHFWPVFELFLGSLKSVSVFLLVCFRPLASNVRCDQLFICSFVLVFVVGKIHDLRVWNEKS